MKQGLLENFLEESQLHAAVAKITKKNNRKIYNSVFILKNLRLNLK